MLGILIIVAIVILFFVFALIAEKERKNKTGDLPKALEAKQEVKTENRQKILDLINRQSVISNNDVEKLLQVSDATATRYLQELERMGELIQKNETGRGVTYEKRLK